MGKFRTTHYDVSSDKISFPIRLAVVADLHNHVYQPNNKPLLQAIQDIKPDLIMIPGDLFTEDETMNTEKAEIFLREAINIAPVYYSNGNHETRIKRTEAGNRVSAEFECRMRDIGVVFLNNTSSEIEIHNQKVLISGYEADMKYYAKGRPIHMPVDEVFKTLNSERANVNSGNYHILLAHNPVFFDAYKFYGSDLTLSGHMHGGLVRIPGIGSLISPQFKLLPKYDAGHFEEEGKHLIISKGLGTHTFNIRVFNRAELLDVCIKPN